MVDTLSFSFEGLRVKNKLFYPIPERNIYFSGRI